MMLRLIISFLSLLISINGFSARNTIDVRPLTFYTETGTRLQFLKEKLKDLHSTLPEDGTGNRELISNLVRDILISQKSLGDFNRATLAFPEEDRKRFIQGLDLTIEVLEFAKGNLSDPEKGIVSVKSRLELCLEMMKLIIQNQELTDLIGSAPSATGDLPSDADEDPS